MLQKIAHLAWMQRRDAQYYQRAIDGHDPTHLTATKSQLQREAAKASKETRDMMGVNDGMA